MKRTILQAVILAVGIVLMSAFGANASAKDFIERHGIKPSFGIMGGAAVPKVFESGNWGGFLGINTGIQIGDYVQFDVLDLTGFFSEQSEKACPASCFNFNRNYDGSALFVGSAARVGVFKDSWRVNPFAIGGVGGGWTVYQFNRIGLDHTEGGFAYNVGGGLETKINGHWFAGLLYRYYNAEQNDLIKTNAQLHVVAVELSWR